MQRATQARQASRCSWHAAAHAKGLRRTHRSVSLMPLEVMLNSIRGVLKPSFFRDLLLAMISCRARSTTRLPRGSLTSTLPRYLT